MPATILPKERCIIINLHETIILNLIVPFYFSLIHGDFPKRFQQAQFQIRLETVCTNHSKTNLPVRFTV